MKNQRISHALVIMVFGTFFSLLCSTLMNIALPTFMNVFHISEAQVQWVTNGYMLVNALMIPVSSFLIKRFPFKNLFIIFSGIFLFGIQAGFLLCLCLLLTSLYLSTKLYHKISSEAQLENA